MSGADAHLGTMDGSHIGQHLDVHLHTVNELSEKDIEKGEIINDDLVAEFITEKGPYLDGVLDEAKHMPLEEARAILQDTVNSRKTDPLFDQQLLRRAIMALNETDLDASKAHALVEELKLQAALIDDSPYLEVRSAVSNTDDPTIPVNTFRAWVIGMLFTTIGTGVNTFFSARWPLITLNTFCAQVLAYPVGIVFAKVLPSKEFTTFGYRWSLNPGPFNQKEHMLITIMANVTFGGIGVYSTDIIFVQRLPQYFNQNALASQFGYQILLTLSTQLLGFSVAGLARRFLVYPPAMIWPSALATIVLNRSFHEDKNPVANGWRVSRLKFFWVVFTVYGLYFVFPQAIFQALSYFNWMVWISPNNVTLALVTGSVTGLGFNPWPTFDVNYFYINPWITPLFATLNLMAGMLFLATPFIAIVYWNNIWNTAYLPMNTSGLFDNTGGSYNISKVLNPDFTLNTTAYINYSQPYQSAAYANLFFWFFGTYTATLVHVALYHWREIAWGFKAAIARQSARDAYNDVHNRLMRNYKEVPEWWFMSVMVVSLVFGIAVNEHYDTQFPVWGMFFGLLLTLIFLVPAGVVNAVTNMEVTLNVFGEMIGGFALPGKPLAVMIFKTYSVVTGGQAIGYASDMKLGHYIKIPPRLLFSAQMVASVWACFVGLAVCDWQLTHIKDLCTPEQVNDFNCAATYAVFFNSAVQWGAIGPKRLYGEGRTYNHVLFGFLAGALMPIIPWYLAQRFPLGPWKYISAPLLMYGGIFWAPGNISYMITPLYVSLIFQYYIRRRYVAWWSKYNYLLSTAIYAGIALFGIIWFFAILYKDKEPVWWGNTVSFDNCDGNGCPLKAIPEIGYFGPAPGTIKA